MLHEGEIHEADDEVDDEQPQVLIGSESVDAVDPQSPIIHISDEHVEELSGNDLWGLIDNPIEGPEPLVGPPVTEPPVVELLPEPLPV